MTDYQIFYQQIEEIMLRINRWMTFIEIVEITGFVLSITALVLLVIKVRDERKKGKHI
jgi:hypothetical protein